MSRYNNVIWELFLRNGISRRAVKEGHKALETSALLPDEVLFRHPFISEGDLGRIMGADTQFLPYLVPFDARRFPSTTITLWRLVFAAASGLVRQRVTKKSAISPFDMNIFDPLMMYPSSALTALVETLRTSLPASGSVTATAWKAGVLPARP